MTIDEYCKMARERDTGCELRPICIGICSKNIEPFRCKTIIKDMDLCEISEIFKKASED
jgi:hypothetical protein